VLGSSKKTVESLGKITDEYIKGWGLVEKLPDIRYRYCLMNDKIGAKWLDALLEFSQLSVENRTEWLNKFMRNWSYANGDNCTSSPPSSPPSASEDDPLYKAVPPSFYNAKEELNSEEENSQSSEQSGAVSSASVQELDHSLKRGRSSNDMDDMEDYMSRCTVVEAEPDLHKRLRWEFVKNMQLMGSIRFELCKKCGMKEECLRIAQQMNDREKIVESRLMSGDNGDDALNEAMNSLLHL